MSDLPPVAYLTRDGQWFARAYEHLETTRYVSDAVYGAEKASRVEWATKATQRGGLVAALTEALRAIVEDYDGPSTAAIARARALLERT